MGQESEELRADIERRRENMTGTIDAIEDRVVPGRIIERRRQAVRGWVGGVRERVMGPPQTLKQQASSAADRVGEGMSHMSDAISGTPAQLQQATAGSPLIAGAVAFGIGALIAAVLPETEPERRAIRAVQPQVDAATDALKEAGQQALETAKGSAQEAAGDLKQSASDHAREVADEAKEAGQQLKESTATADQ
jgi:hypothetical protein